MNTETNTESTNVWGIDLGTTYSCISRVDEFGHAVVVNNSDGDPTTPSVVMFLGPDNIQIGKEAKRQKQMDPDSVVELVKRQMGTPDWGFEAHGQRWSAPEISAQILKALAEDAAQQSGDAVEKVVITVPAYFGIPERDATVAAGRMAGPRGRRHPQRADRRSALLRLCAGLGRRRNGARVRPRRRHVRRHRDPPRTASSRAAVTSVSSRPAAITVSAAPTGTSGWCSCSRAGSRKRTPRRPTRSTTT